MLSKAVKRGASTTAAVDYKIAVSDRARILNYTDPGLAKVTRGNGKEVLFRADAESVQNLKTGDILLAAEVPQTPEGLLRRVVGIEHRGALLCL